ncbi:hypothetical protein AXG93_1433s1350 [Marchantia polymorpha subsp. ruderalis]|uniref:Uncharacterized protein n=1 Tax=Marchantia polymorpha subsp. ruderalis TaxID=1480154 RepID=A0A176WBB6_MARPO|nr:hypothetical protein AXG93_1433s1350 [Marchantia polymorpha subsp. ruderalis]
MDDYHEFGRDFAVEINAWMRHWSSNYLSINQEGVGTSGDVSDVVASGATSSSISEDTSEGTKNGTSGSTGGAAGKGSKSGPSGAAGGATRSGTSGRTGGVASVDTSSDTSSTAIGSLDGVASAVPSFSSIVEFFKRRLRDATVMSDASSTLAHVFALSKKIELNIVEERMVTSSFTKDTPITSRVQHNNAQSHPTGDGSRGVQARPHLGHRETKQCFDLHLEFRSRGRGHGRCAPRGREGRGGRDACAGAIGRPVVGVTPTTDSAMAARIEQLEQRIAAMASSGASTFHEGEDLSYLASAAQVGASVAITRGAACASKPRGATVELDP